jgi:hypothetical protein
MKFSAALIATFAVLAVAAPTTPHQKRAGVLGIKTYDEYASPLYFQYCEHTNVHSRISISGGVAGNAKQEALDVFSALDPTDMASVDPADIDFLGSVNDIGNDAEVGAFNPAIEVASGAEKTALQNGKIKNKVLKLTATSLELQIKAAQGEDTTDKLATETKKLNNNIALDVKAAGQESTKLAFDATTS